MIVCVSLHMQTGSNREGWLKRRSNLMLTLLLLTWTGILLTIFLKDGESTVEIGSISSATYSATSVLTSRGSSIADGENVFAV